MPVFRNQQDLAQFMAGAPQHPSSCVLHKLPCGAGRGCPTCFAEAQKRAKLDFVASQIMNGGGRNDG